MFPHLIKALAGRNAAKLLFPVVTAATAPMVAQGVLQAVKKLRPRDRNKYADVLDVISGALRTGDDEKAAAEIAELIGEIKL